MCATGAIRTDRRGQILAVVVIAGLTTRVEKSSVTISDRAAVHRVILACKGQGRYNEQGKKDYREANAHLQSSFV